MRSFEESRERRLLRLVARGDEAALRRLYDRHASRLATRLAQRGATRTVIEEVLQDTFLAVWSSAATYRGDGDVGAWLWGIASRRFAMAVRSDVRRARRADVAPAGPTGEDDWLAAMVASEQYAALDPTLRDTFVAVAVDGLSHAAAAKRLGIPEGTVKSRMYRVRKQIEE